MCKILGCSIINEEMGEEQLVGNEIVSLFLYYMRKNLDIVCVIKYERNRYIKNGYLFFKLLKEYRIKYCIFNGIVGIIKKYQKQ